MTDATTGNPLLGFIRELLSEHDGLVTGIMFGFPALYYLDPDCLTRAGRPKRRLLLTVTDNGVALKLPDDLVNELLHEPGFEPFSPFHMPPVRGWVLIRRDNPEDYRGDLELFETGLSCLTS